MKRFITAMLACCSAALATAGPVVVYRTGEAFCPRDRPMTARPITSEEAVDRARLLLPADFCGPTFFVSGCTFELELVYQTWRVFALQHRRVGGQESSAGLDHSYIILDAVGNCLANIPGT